MDNDYKINETEEQRHKDVMLFLKEELEPLKFRGNASSYNLEKEYAKTKKNKNLFVPLVLGVCILIVCLTALIMTKSIEHTNRDIKVNVEEFNDVNLKNLIDTVSRTQDQYDSAVKNKKQIENQKKAKLNSAADLYNGDLLTIQSLNLRNKKTQAAREEAARKEYEANVNAINQEFDSLLEEAQEEIDELKAELDRYDSSKVTAAQEQQKLLDSERQLQQLERKQLSDQYERRITDLENTIADNRKTHSNEMRKALTEVSEKLQSEIDALDPVLQDSHAKEIINRPISEIRKSVKFDEHPLFAEGNVTDENLSEKVGEARSLYNDYKYLDKGVQDIPHKNSIGQYVKTNDKLVDQVSGILADTVYEQYLHNVELEAKIAELEESRFDLLYTVMQGAGFSAVIAETPVSKDEIYIYVRPNARFLVTENGVAAEIPFKKPIKGMVFRTEDDRFRFEPEKKGDDYVDFDLTALAIGVQVKIK